MKKQGIGRLKMTGYWIATFIVVFELLVCGTADLEHGPILLFAGDPAEQVLKQLGYPVYLLNILGGVVLLMPLFPRLKGWAFAGSFIALTGAAASWASIGGGPDAIAMPLVFAVPTLVSWEHRPRGRILGTLFQDEGNPDSAMTAG